MEDIGYTIMIYLKFTYMTVYKTTCGQRTMLQGLINVFPSSSVITLKYIVAFLVSKKSVDTSYTLEVKRTWW